MKTLVIGGGGFIGRHLVPLLVNTGRREVVVLGRSPLPRVDTPRGVKYISGDAADPDVLAELMSGCDELVNLAYGTVPKTSFDDPMHDLLTNLPLAVTMFRQASAMKVAKILHISSGGTVYGNAEYLPIDERHPTNPVSPYGITKLTTEKYAQLFLQTEGLPVVIARPGNPYGPAQDGGRGQGFVGAAIAAMLAHRPVSIYGTRGTVRDYIYIQDLAEGLLATLDCGRPGDIYNIGTGVGHDNLQVLELLDVVARDAGYYPKYEILPERAFDVTANILDSSRLTDISGWRPKTAFNVGLQATWTWAAKKHLSGKLDHE